MGRPVFSPKSLVDVKDVEEALELDHLALDSHFPVVRSGPSGPGVHVARARIRGCPDKHALGYVLDVIDPSVDEIDVVLLFVDVLVALAVGPDVEAKLGLVVCVTEVVGRVGVESPSELVILR